MIALAVLMSRFRFEKGLPENQAVAVQKRTVAAGEGGEGSGPRCGWCGDSANSGSIRAKLAPIFCFI